MKTLHFTTSGMTMPLCLQGLGPEVHDGNGTHQLILIQAQFLFAEACEDLIVPSLRDVRQESLWTRLQITRRPARLGDGCIQGMTHDHDLTAVQAAHPRRHDMHLHRVLALWPADLERVARAQLSNIGR